MQNDAKAEKAVMHECELNHIGTKATIVPSNRDHIEIYVLSMFLCFYPEQSGQVVVQKFQTETLLKSHRCEVNDGIYSTDR